MQTSQITVRYFAGIREQLGRREDRLETTGIVCVADVWRQLVAFPLPANTLIAVNQEYARSDTPVRPGDEVAFFPPVTGG
jgi:molybdopterin synthase sulfur carrier subunit